MAEQPLKTPEECAGRVLSVLIVEDNLVNQKVIDKLLETSGYMTDIASNGKVALEALENFSYDLILMDIQMPEMDGFETTKTIRSWSTSDSEIKRTVSDIPIIALTAHAMKQDRERCLNAGMNDYISKPVNKHELMLTIDRCLSAFQRGRREKQAHS